MADVGCRIADVGRALAWIAIAWAPYLTLRLWWGNLVATVPGAEHGEASGPVLYFLPRLLVAAVAATVLVIAVVIWKVCRVKTNAKSMSDDR